MKVSIITILDNTNFGTYLQALATGLTIKKLGHKPEIVRYTRECMTPKGNSIAILKDRGILRWFYRCVLHNNKAAWKLRSLDYEFLTKFIDVTDEYVGFQTLLSNPPMADAYLTGSDQVWNSVYNRGIDKSFYLDFAPVGKKRIAYAASIGMPDIPKDEMAETKALLEKYSHITVRETSAEELLRRIDVDSEVVLDPTLLLDKSEWTSIANKYEFNPDAPYLLTYSVEYGNEDSVIKHYAQKIAKERGLKIYHVSYSGQNKIPDYVDKAFPLATPDLFLNLMQNASFVVVSSFHGTAFSINFNKQFLTVAPSRFNSRINSLLNILGLKDRIVCDCSLSTENLGDIDYNRVNVLLEKQRQFSINILKTIIEN